MANREFLMKSHPYKSKTKKTLPDVRGWWASEKMDGVRAFWDGGISRGLQKSSIPYANNKDKDDRYVETPIATGLWSSYGNPIYAPDWFLDQLPDVSLDGELWMGRGLFQKTTSAVSKLTPVDSEWDYVTFNVFDLPPLPMVFQTGTINNVHFQKEMDLNACMDFVRRRRPNYNPRFYTVEQALAMLTTLPESLVWRPIEQTKVTTQEDVDTYLLRILELGGEGVVYRKPKSYWEPKRSHMSYKLKPYNDAEGIVKGYIWGRETDKGSKLLGKMGAMILDYKGKRLELSGFTDEEREMTFHPFPRENFNADDMNFAAREGEIYPGKEVSRDWTNQKFPRGTLVTFRYRELTDDNVPKEAHFDRIRFGHA